MGSRTREAAAQDYITGIRRLLSCIVDAHVVRGRLGNGADFVRTAPRSLPLSGGSRVALSFIQGFALSSEPADDGLWRVASNGYWYELTTRDGAEVIAYHWHPSQDQRVRFPHLHITGGAPSAVVTRRSHVPTGRVSLAAVVRFAIAELGVLPQRPDWERVLGAAD